MKVTKSTLKQIIREEKAKLNEAWGDASSNRAHGLYFDVNMTQQVGSALDALFHNAMDAAEEDGLEVKEAYWMIIKAIRQLVEDEIMAMRY